MIKVFLPDKIIYLTDDKTLLLYRKNSIFISIGSMDEMQVIYEGFVHKSHLPEIYFFNENLEKLFHYFSALFHVIEAAGGLVKNKKGEWLLIFRHGKWDLPKGKIEKGEGIEKAAIREVEEECGISGLTILKELTSTYHTYYIEKKAILKRTYWFGMRCDDTSKLVPQIEEGITDAKWLALTDFQQVYRNTFESVKEVLKEIKTI